MSDGKDITPIFALNKEDNEVGFAEEFRDKVRTLFEHFDKDGDKYLNFPELAALQVATSGDILTEDMYVMACRALGCPPSQGLSLDALKLTYASEGANIDKDYEKVFSKPATDGKSKAEKSPSDAEAKEEEQIYEAGDGGICIPLLYLFVSCTTGSPPERLSEMICFSQIGQLQRIQRQVEERHNLARGKLLDGRLLSVPEEKITDLHRLHDIFLATSKK